MFFDWKIQLEQEQLTQHLKGDIKLNQGNRFFLKNDQGYCDPTTRTQETIVWLPEDTCTTFQIAEIHARMIMLYKNYSIDSITFNIINSERTRSKPNQYKNTHGIENKLQHFQIYPETEIACKKPKTLF